MLNSDKIQYHLFLIRDDLRGTEVTGCISSPDFENKYLCTCTFIIPTKETNMAAEYALKYLREMARGIAKYSDKELMLTSVHENQIMNVLSEIEALRKERESAPYQYQK